MSPINPAPEMDPIARFQELMERARAMGAIEPTAAAVATADAEARPDVRMMLLKEADAQGFAFFTNMESRKAAELSANPRVALCFYWDVLEAQVRVEGPASPVSEEEADAYFATRPRGSQIGAWASRQSRPLAERAELERRVAETERRFEGAPVPRPPFWSGFRVAPHRIEFWTARANRLHDREVYLTDGQGGWTVERLYP